MFQDGGERGAGVFGVDIDATAEDRLVTDIAACEIEASLDGKASLVFDLLCDKLAKNELLGEILGADYDAVLAGWAAGNEHPNENGDWKPAGCRSASWGILIYCAGSHFKESVISSRFSVWA